MTHFDEEKDCPVPVKESLTKDDLIVLANTFSGAQVRVADAQKAIELLQKLQRLIETYT